MEWFWLVMFLLSTAHTSIRCFSSQKNAHHIRHLSTMKSDNLFKRLDFPIFVSAPMVDQSELAWRLLTKRNGAHLAFSQMIHAKNFCNYKRYRNDCIDWDDYSTSTGNFEIENEAKSLDRDIIIQFAGDDPNILVEAGKYVHHRAAAIDLNLGCPQKIAKRGHYGAYLLQDSELVVKLLTAMVQRLDCPITAKIRVLEDDEATLRLCRKMEKCGIQMLTVHGRTVDSSKLFTGPADWDIIKKIKNEVGIPVVANGGISCREDALRCLKETGADGVMSSEGLLENPKLFSEEGDRLFRTDYIRAQMQTVDDYMETVKLHCPQKQRVSKQDGSVDSINVEVVRSHLFKMLFRFIDADVNKDLREKLAVGREYEIMEVIQEIKNRLAVVDFDTRSAEERGLIGATSWYNRHRSEKAANRIISARRSKRTNAPQAAAVPVTTATLQELKLKLQARRQERISAVTPSVNATIAAAGVDS